METLSGPTITTLSGLAKKHHCYVVCPIYRDYQSRRINSSVLIYRTRKVVSVYDKIYPYWNEFYLTPPAVPWQEDVSVYDAYFQGWLRYLLLRQVPGSLPAPALQ